MCYLVPFVVLLWKSAVFSQYPRSGGKTGSGTLMGYSMRTDRYRFTVWVDRKDHSKVDAAELYDHQNDPQEDTNIAKDPTQAATVERLMTQWRQGSRGRSLPQVVTRNLSGPGVDRVLSTVSLLAADVS